MDPGGDRTDVYTLDATVSEITVDQAAAKLVDGSTIMATDLVVIAGRRWSPPRLTANPPLALSWTCILPRSMSYQWWTPATVVKVMPVPSAGAAIEFVVRS